MSNVLIEKDKLDVLATAIANKSGEPLKLTLAEMVEAVDGIETGGGGITPTGNIDITGAGVTDVTNYATATVPTATADCGGSGAYSTESGVRKWKYTSSAYAEDAGWVDEGTFGTKTSTYNAVPTGTAITPTESAQTVGGANYMMEGAVTVEAVPTGSITNASWSMSRPSGTGKLRITHNQSKTAGYISSGSISNYKELTLETETVTPSTSSQTVTPTDDWHYLDSVTVAAMPSGSATPASSISATGATVSTGTNTLTLSKSVSNTPQVSAGYISSGTAGNSSVSLTANVTTKAAATITPSTTNQTIASGTYLTGTQTIAGDADLVGGNILSTANIFGVQGTVVVQNYYTGSSAPSSSLGSNGDLYLQA